MGSKFKKTLLAESVRESLHSWCKRVKTKRSPLLSRNGTTTSICSLDTADMDDETITVSTLSRTPSMDDLPEATLDEQAAYKISRLWSTYKFYLLYLWSCCNVISDENSLNYDICVHSPGLLLTFYQRLTKKKKQKIIPVSSLLDLSALSEGQM